MRPAEGCGMRRLDLLGVYVAPAIYAQVIVMFDSRPDRHGVGRPLVD
jgi:hypothetical protein